MPLTAVLLAAGFATRLYPLTKHRPKALLPLGEGTILDAVMASVTAVPRVSRTILVTNHRFAAQFRAWRARHGADVDILDDGTDSPATRLGAIRDIELVRTRRKLRGDLLVLGTDNLFTWSLAEFVAGARGHRPWASVALGRVRTKREARQLGVVTRNRSGRLTGFHEKPARPPSTAVALCVYYFPHPMQSQLSAYLRARGNPDAPGYFVQWLVQTSTIYGVPMGGAWYDIGTRESYRNACQRPWAGRVARPVRRVASKTTPQGGCC